MSSTTRSRKPGLAVAALIFLNAATARLLLTADATAVYLMGTALPSACALRAETGIPCPTCGWSRAAVLTLHGDFAVAWSLAPGAVAAVAGTLLFALLLLLNALASRPRAATLRRTAVAYAALCVVVSIAGWVMHLVQQIAPQ